MRNIGKDQQFYFKILFFLHPSYVQLWDIWQKSVQLALTDKSFFIKVHKLNHYRYTESYKLHKLFCHSLQVYDSNSKKLILALFIFTVVIRTYNVLYIKYLNNNDILL